MSDMASDWRTGLTPEQVQTVEKATRAAHGDRAKRHAGFGTFDGMYERDRDAWCLDTLAALIASGHPDFPPPKVPSRGAVVAEDVVNLSMGHLRFMWPDGTGQIMEMRNPDDCLRWTRQAVAAHIDAERAAALDLAAKLVADDYYASRVELAKAILALKGAK